MPPLNAFSTPARQDDFPPGSPQQAQLDALWSTRVEGFTQQAIVGNPWTGTYQANQTSYYDPLVTSIPAGTAAALVSWSAFPNRLIQYLGQAQMPPQNPYNLSNEKILELADTGGAPGSVEFSPIPTVHCPQADWGGTLGPYGPYGPRGWLDEYCEWSVTRDDQGRILRVDFTCENPEYWYTLWQIDQQRVAALYEQTLNAGAPPERQISVAVEDLWLLDPDTREPVIDPFTQLPAYDPLNKWNTGTVSTRTGSASDSGGAMHLTSTPNTLQTELGLAGGATVLRQGGSADPQALICCGQYGQSYRNSDPHIGQGVNQAVSGSSGPPLIPPAIVSLADPVGLYIQPPNWDLYTAPHDDLDVRECWQLVRGAPSLVDPETGSPFPGAFMLHVAFQIPAHWPAGYTVSSIRIADPDTGDPRPINWAGQIAQTFEIGLFPRPIKAPAADPQPCVGTPAQPLPQPLQLFSAELFKAYYGTPVKNPVGMDMSLASNTVIVPPRVEQGASASLALACASVTAGQAPKVVFSGGGDVAVTNVGVPEDIAYAVPGNTYPGPCQLVTFEVAVSRGAAPGVRSLTLVDANGAAGPAAPAFLEVVAAG